MKVVVVEEGEEEEGEQLVGELVVEHSVEEESSWCQNAVGKVT